MRKEDVAQGRNTIKGQLLLTPLLLCFIIGFIPNQVHDDSINLPLKGIEPFLKESNLFSSESNLFSNESKRYSRFLTDAFKPITYVIVATIAPRIAVVKNAIWAIWTTWLMQSPPLHIHINYTKRANLMQLLKGVGHPTRRARKPRPYGTKIRKKC